MPDTRPAPQYGEYATPEEVAALRGVPVEVPAVSSPAPASAPAPRSVAVPPVIGLRRYDRMLTIVFLLFGAINLVQYAAPLLDFEAFLEEATVGTPAEPVDFGDEAQIGGYVLFGVSLVLLLLAGFFAVQLLRRRRIAFWVPLVAGALTVLAWLIVLVAIVLQTPDALSYPLTLTSPGS